MPQYGTFNNQSNKYKSTQLIKLYERRGKHTVGFWGVKANERSDQNVYQVSDDIVEQIFGFLIDKSVPLREAKLREVSLQFDMVYREIVNKVLTSNINVHANIYSDFMTKLVVKNYWEELLRCMLIAVEHKELVANDDINRFLTAITELSTKKQDFNIFLEAVSIHNDNYRLKKSFISKFFDDSTQAFDGIVFGGLLLHLLYTSVGYALINAFTSIVSESNPFNGLKLMLQILLFIELALLITFPLLKNCVRTMRGSINTYLDWNNPFMKLIAYCYPNFRVYGESIAIKYDQPQELLEFVHKWISNYIPEEKLSVHFNKISTFIKDVFDVDGIQELARQYDDSLSFSEQRLPIIKQQILKLMLESINNHITDDGTSLNIDVHENNYEISYSSLSTAIASYLQIVLKKEFAAVNGSTVIDVPTDFMDLRPRI